MSADIRFRYLWKILLAGLILFTNPLQGNWESALEEADYPGREFSETAFLVVMRDILDAAQERYSAEVLPSPEIYSGEDVNLQRLVSLRIPALSTLQALEYAGRRAGFQVSIRENQIQITSLPPRDAGRLRNLEESLALQNLLLLALKQPEQPVEAELLDYAAYLLSRTKIVRLGVPESGRIPVEYAALQVVLNSPDPIPLLRNRMEEASPAGFYYLAAGLNSLGFTPDLKEKAQTIPITVEGGNLIVLESGDTLYQDYIITGELWKIIEKATSPESL